MRLRLQRRNSHVPPLHLLLKGPVGGGVSPERARRPLSGGGRTSTLGRRRSDMTMGRTKVGTNKKIGRKRTYSVLYIRSSHCVHYRSSTITIYSVTNHMILMSFLHDRAMLTSLHPLQAPPSSWLKVVLACAIAQNLFYSTMFCSNSVSLALGIK